MKQKLRLFTSLLLLAVASAAWGETGTITFGNGQNGTVSINSASVTGSDNLNNTWTITTEGTTSFTPNADYSQVGSSKKPATSITLTTTLPKSVTITAFSAKFGGFGDTAGSISLKVGDTEVGTGSLNGTNDVTVNSTPNAAGTVLTVTVTGIAKGVKVYNVSYTYTTGEVKPVCEMPTFDPAASAVTKGTVVTISTTTEGATIYYTTGDSDPLTSGTQGNTVTITEATTIKAIAVKEGCENSGVASASYTIAKVAKPTFSPEEGDVDAGTVVTISTTTEDATIYYTTDGSEPSTSSTQGNTVTINAATTIKAIAVRNDMADSNVATAVYTLKGASVSGYTIDFEESASSYTDWTFTNAESAKTGSIEAHGGTYYGTTGGKTTASIQTKEKVATPGVFTCYVSKQSTNTTSSTWYIQVSEDGSEWTDVKTQSATSMSKGEWLEFTADLSAYSNVYVRLYYSGSTAVRNVDDISLTMASSLAAPIISLASGTYDEVKSVTITAETGATIYYTLDGSTPNTESTEYIGAISISRSCTLKAIAVKDGVSSNVASATYTLNVPLTIAEVREQGTGSVVKTIGVVTSCVGKNVYIQDATAAILVYGDEEITDLAIGDEIVVSGTLATYKGLLEIKTPTYTKNSEGNTVTPEVMTVAQVNESEKQGWLVKIENATVTAIEGSNTTIDQDGATILVFGISSDVTLAVGDIITLTGNIGCFNSVQIANPRDITITENYVTFDEKANQASDFAAVYNANVGGNKNVKMLREFGSDYWNTLVVPFDLTRAQLEEAFGEDVQVAKYTGFKTPANIKFETTTGDVTRADLLLVKPTATVTNPIFKGVTLEEGKAYTYPEISSSWADGTLFKIAGRFAKQVLTDDDFGKVYFLNKKGQFTHPTADGNVIRGFRWFIQLKTPESSTGAKIALDVDGDVTSIDAIDNGQFATDAIYNLSGQRVNKAQKGIYIVNGKKVVVK